MLTFVAITPHSPILLPTIGKEHHKKLKKTIAAYKMLEEDIYASKPNTIVVLSPHGTTVPDALAIHICKIFKVNLKEFGDLATSLEFKANPKLTEEIRALRYKNESVPLATITEDFLDYGSAIPLYFLTQHLPGITIIPIGRSNMAVQAHFDIGKLLGEILQSSSQRVAVIASADLAHTLTDSAPGGFSPEGKKFDTAIVQALRKDDHESILKLENKMETVKTCGLRVIAMLLGIIENMNCTPEPLSYEGPFGVGYLTARFKLY